MFNVNAIKHVGDIDIWKYLFLQDTILYEVSFLWSKFIA